MVNNPASNGQWSAVNGQKTSKQRSMVSGQWSKTSKQRSMVGSQWSKTSKQIVNGQRSMVNRRRSMISILQQWSAVNGHFPSP
jgi:hypothetical protein